MNPKIFAVFTYTLCFALVLGILIPVSGTPSHMNPHSLTGTDSRHSLDSPAIGKLNTKDNALKSEGVLSRAPIPAQKSAIVSHPQHAMPNHTVPVISAPAMTSKLNSSKYSFQKITSPRSFFEARFNLKKNQTGKHLLQSPFQRTQRRLYRPTTSLASTSSPGWHQTPHRKERTSSSRHGASPLHWPSPTRGQGIPRQTRSARSSISPLHMIPSGRDTWNSRTASTAAIPESP